MITDSQVDQYHETGCVVVEGILGANVLGALRDAVDELVERSRDVTGNDELYDLEDDHTPERPRVRRLKEPNRHHRAFADLPDHPAVVAVLERLWDNGVRFDKSKLNLKLGGGGAAVEWHQDWAFYPHTNDDLAAVGFLIDDMAKDNGPLMVVPGSHRGPVHDHHADGCFCGGIDVEKEGVDVSEAIALTGPAGAITVHHVRALHGSAPNLSDRPRRLLLHQYCAADAWPLLGIGDYDEFRGGLVSGEEVLAPRMEPVPVRLPYPAATNQGSIYENQRALGGRFF